MIPLMMMNCRWLKNFLFGLVETFDSSVLKIMIMMILIFQLRDDFNAGTLENRIKYINYKNKVESCSKK